MLSSDLITELITYAQSQKPMEMCGLLFSRNRWICCINSATDPTRGFLLSPDQYMQSSHFFGELPWALVHSHPEKSAGLSIKDCALMDALQLGGQDLSMVIVGLKPVEIRCFRKVGERYSLQGCYARNEANGEWFGSWANPVPAL